MRSLFNRTLVEIARKNTRIYLILADIGYGEVETFMETFPHRFYNVGVAEQCMAGVACGMAMEGNIPIIYTINNFVFVRCLEQIRNDICYHDANVKIVIVGGGLHYGALGISHHCREDLAIMRSLANMVVCAPCDLAEAAAAAHAMIEYEGPFCYRCGRKGEPPVHDGPIDFRLGQAIRVRDGADATIIFTGTIGNQVLPAAEELEKDGVKCRVISMHTVKPIDKQAILSAAQETGAIITVEEHTINGGLGGAVAEVLCDAGVHPKRFLRLALPDEYSSLVGSQKWLLDQHGLSAPRIAAAVRKMIRGK